MPPGGSGDDVTLGEVARNLDALAKQMERGFERVDDRFNTLAMVHSDVYLADRAADRERRKADLARIEVVEGRVDKIDKNGQYLWRTIVGAVIAAVITIVAAVGGYHP